MAERLTRQQRQQQTRERLLEAAQRLIAERGLATSLDDVAAAAALTKGAVYSNFASKQDLLLALVERRSSQQSGPAEIIADESVAVDERFAALGRGYAECLQAPRNRDFVLLTIELWLAAMRDPRLRTGYAEAIRGIRHAIAEVIERQFGGPHQTQTTLDMATLIMALDTGLAIQHLIDPHAVPGQLYSDAIQLILQPRVGSH